MCQLDGLDWPCAQVATALLFELVGTAEVVCEVDGHDRFERALAVCYRGERELTRAPVRHGSAPVWYPERGAVLGPDDAAAEATAREAGRGMWRGGFVGPWLWRRERP